MPVHGYNAPAVVTAPAWTADSGTKPVALATADFNYLRHPIFSPTSGTIIAKDFGFAITGSDTINGIRVEVLDAFTNDMVVDPTERVFEVNARLTKDGTTAIGSTWDATVIETDTNHTLGTASELWGLSWTAAELNSANFGVILEYSVNDPVGEAIRVDRVRIIINTSTTVTPSPITVLGSRWRRIPDVCTDSAKRAKVSK